MTPVALTPDASPISLFEAVVLGLVEGVTEFLPISSTGHLIVAQRLLGLPAGTTNNVFAIGIQMGAITAILVLYWRRLLAAARTIARPAAGPNLLWQIALAALPAAVVGLLLDDWIDEHLFSVPVVALTLVAGGGLLLALERLVHRSRTPRIELTAMPYGTAALIGLFQCLALVPGTSRAATTIGGALLLGLSRTAAAEFSFLVGLPILYGASSWKLLSHLDLLRGDTLLAFGVGTLVSFVSALVVVGPFVRFLRTHTFALFAWYRIAAGLALGGGCLGGWFD